MKVFKLLEESEFAALEKNKVSLTNEERAEVLAKKAIWHKGPNGEPSVAVWKSVNPRTKKTTYISNTHRLYKTASTLRGAIGLYHKYIKQTAYAVLCIR